MLLAAVLMCGAAFADDGLFGHARALQREGKYDEAVVAFKSYLLQPVGEDDFTGQRVVLYTEALVQLMNTYQSKGEPEACILALQEVFDGSLILQGKCFHPEKSHREENTLHRMYFQLGQIRILQ